MSKCEKCRHQDPDLKDRYEPQTNADRIRAMSDEELATQLVRVFCEGVKLLTEIDVPDEIADEFRDSVLKRLKQPAEVE